jgi:ubiquinone/menaquinone biosynthesis C-methylase UbiE
LFFDFQKKHFGEVLSRARLSVDLSRFESVLDVGCGTGALCSVLHSAGLSVTGVEPAVKMLNIARQKLADQGISLLGANVLESLPFDDNSFDISIASYVAHGMQKEERRKLYAEMSRVARSLVIIYDYNQKRNLLTSFVEWLERGDYFQFIKHAETEMRGCVSDLNECFSEVKVIDVSERASWFVCKPNKQSDRIDGGLKID